MSKLPKNLETQIFEHINRRGFEAEIEQMLKLIKKRWIVGPSEYYVDPDTGKGREIDLVARRQLFFNKNKKTGAGASLVISVKKTKNPILLLTRKAVAIDKDESEVIITGVKDQIIFKYGDNFDKNLIHVFFGPRNWHHQLTKDTIAFQLCEIKLNKGNLSGVKFGIFNDYIIPVAKAADYYIKSLYSRVIKHYEPDEKIPLEEDVTFVICFPILLLEADLYSIDLDTYPHEVKKTEWEVFKTKIVSDGYPFPCRIDIVSTNFFDKYLDGVFLDTAKEFSKLLINKSDDIREPFVVKDTKEKTLLDEFAVLGDQCSLFGDGKNLIEK